LSTGRFLASQFEPGRLKDELARIGPVELLVSEDAADLPVVVGNDHLLVTRRPAWVFSHHSARETLTKQFGVQSLDGFGFTTDDTPAVRAAGAILDYLKETQKASLDHLDRLIPYRPGTTLEIDESTRRSLEIHRTIREG